MKRFVSILSLLLVLCGVAVSQGPPIPTDGLKVHLQAGIGTSTTVDGAGVSSWADQSGNNHHATQPTEGSRPVYRANGMNSMPALEFSTDFLILSNTHTIGIRNSDYEMFIVARSSNTGIQFLTSRGGGISAYEIHLNGTSPSLGVRYIPKSGITLDKGTNGQYTDGNPHIFSARASSTGGAVRVDGADGQTTTSNAQSADSADLLLGIRGDGGLPLVGFIAEVIIYNRVLTASERNQVESYLANTYFSNPTTVYVDDDFASGSSGNHIFGYNAFSYIQAGVNVVADGGTVIVHSGTYNEQVVISTHVITLDGQGSGATRPLIDNKTSPTGSGHGIVINSNVTDVTIDNFRITAQNTTILGMWGNNSTTISNSELYGGNKGVQVNNSSSVSLTSNTVRNNSQGVVLSNVNTSELVSNTITNNGPVGLLLVNGSYHNLIRNNTITGNGVGIKLDNGNTNTIWNNSISNNTGTGIDLFNSSYNNSVSYNDITGNGTGGPAHGIFVENTGWAYDNVFAQNNIYGNSAKGLDAVGSSYVNAQHNWWGNASGPTNTTNNPGGSGQSVSNNVIFFYHKSAAITRNASQTGPVVIGSTVYRSLGVALEYANTSDVVTVRQAGLYEDYPSFNDNNVQLLGAGRDLSYVFLPDSYLYVGYSGAVVDGIDLDGSVFIDPQTGKYEVFSSEGGNNDVIYIDDSNITIRNNRIRGGYEGIYDSYYDNTYENNHIFWNHYYGIYTNDYPNTIKGNIVYQNGDVDYVYNEYDDGNAGIYLYWGGATITNGNIIANNLGNGIFDYDGENVIVGNTIGSATGTFVGFPAPINYDSLASYYAPGKVVGSPNLPGVGLQMKKQRTDALGLPRTKSGALTKEAKKQLAEQKKLEREQKIAMKDQLRLQHRQQVEELKRQRAAAHAARAQDGALKPQLKTSNTVVTLPKIQTVTSMPGNFLNGAFLYYYENVFKNNTVRDNGATYLFPEESDYRGTLYPAGVKTGGSENLISKNTISNNYFAGVVLQEGNYLNTVWNNTISGNGFATEGEGAGVFITDDGEYASSVSANIISGNKGHGVFMDNSNGWNGYIVVAMNNITANTVSGVTHDPGVYEYYLNAQHNWWGAGSGPSTTTNSTAGAQLVSSDVVTLFHKSAPLPLPVTTPGPVVADGREFISIGYALYDIYYGGEERRFDGVPSRFSGSRTAGQSGTQAGLPAKQMAGLRTMNANTVSLIEVNIAGLAEYEYDVDLENDGMTLRGAGKDLSYIDLSGDRIDVYANGVTIEKLDLDNLYMLDVETGNTVSLRGPGWEGYSGWRIIDVDEYNNAKIKNNRIRGASGYGVSVRWSTGTLVENNEIFWNGVSGVYDYYAENTTIRGNTIFENGSLYYNLEGKRSPAGEATTTAAASNTSYPSYGAGIYGRYTEGAVITNNDVFDNVGHGVYLYNISESNIVNNRIYDNGWIAYDNDGGSGSGLVLDAGNGYYNTANAIVGNTIANNAGEGVYDYYSNYNIYSNNVIGEATLQTSTRRAQRATGGLSLKRSTNSAPRHAVSLKRSAVNEAARSHEEAAWAKLSKDEMLTKLRSQWEAQRALAKATREQEREDDSRDATQRRDGNTQRSLKKSGSTPSLGRLTTPNLSSRQLTPLDGNLLTGVYFDYARNAILSGNTIRGNDTEDEYGGVFLSNSSRDNLVVGNTIENNGSIGIQLDSDYNHNNIIVANRILNNSENGVWVDNNNSGTLVQFNVIAGHTQYGVRNVGTTEANRVDARYSYWGAADGPGGTNVNDPVTNKLASGTGNNVSANVRFDPFVPVVPSALAASTVPGSVTDTVIVFGNTGITVNFSPTGSGGLLVVGSFNITPPTGPFQDPSGGTTFQFLNRYWEIVEGGMTGFTSSITFSYAGVSGVTNPSGLRIARRANFSGSGVPWVLVAIGNTIINTSNQTITVTGITDFSQWTLLMVPSAPTVASVTPSQAFRGTSMQLDIAGTNFNSTTALNFGNDISVSSLQLLSPNQLRAIIVIPAAAALGQRAVTISNGGPGGGSSTFNFLVLNPSPTVFSISPQSGNRGSSATVTVNGSGFIPGLGGTTLDFGGGITVGFVSVISGNQLTASISIANTATAGTKTVTVANSAPGGGAATTSFTVNNPAPTVTSVTPNSGTQGQTLTVSLGGSGFFAGVTTVGFGAGVTVNSVVMISSSLLQASITIGPTATTGPRSVSVTNAAPGGGTVSLANAFTVNPGVPSSVELISGLIPTEFGLMQNYPNPFNPATSIRFALPERSSVKLTLFNTLGIEVSVLVDDELEPGVYQYRLAADQLPTGMYIYTLKAQSSADGTSKAYSSSKKMVLVK